MKGYEAFVVELKEPVDVCLSRNIHQRTKEEIEDVNESKLFMHVHMYTCMYACLQYMYM